MILGSRLTTQLVFGRVLARWLRPSREFEPSSFAPFYQLRGGSLVVYRRTGVGFCLPVEKPIFGFDFCPPSFPSLFRVMYCNLTKVQGQKVHDAHYFTHCNVNNEERMIYNYCSHPSDRAHLRSC